MRGAIAYIAAGLFAATAAAEPVAWRVVNVHDGDTVTALDEENVQHRIRLQGIDAPETGQPFGRAARDDLVDLVKGKTVSVEQRGRDRYGRVLATLEVGGEDVGSRMVARGLAWHYVRFSKDERLAAAEREARAARRGLWGDPSPVPPWDWRAAARGRRQPASGR